MARRYRILQKKVGELESEVGNLVPRRNVQSAELPYAYFYDDDFDKAIKGKFVFARRLLSAELQMVANNQQRPQHLHHIESRLDALEAAFLSWVLSRSSDGVVVDTSCACACNCCSNDDDEAEMWDDFGSLLDEEEDLLRNRVEDEEEGDEGDLQTFSCKEFEEAKLGAAGQEAMITAVEREKKDDEQRRWSTRKSLKCGWCLVCFWEWWPLLLASLARANVTMGRFFSCPLREKGGGRFWVVDATLCA